MIYQPLADTLTHGLSMAGLSPTVPSAAGGGFVSYDGASIGGTISGITAHSWTDNAQGLFNTATNLAAEWIGYYQQMIEGHSASLTPTQRLEAQAEAMFKFTGLGKRGAAQQKAVREDVQRETAAPVSPAPAAKPAAAPAPVPTPAPQPVTVTRPTPIPDTVPVPVPAAAPYHVPHLVLAPPYFGVGLGHSGTPGGAELSAMLASPDQWPTLLSYKPLIQEASERVGSGATLQAKMAGLNKLGLTYGIETTPMSAALIKAGGNIGANAFAADSKTFDRIIAAGGKLAEVSTNDPLAIALSDGMARPAALQQIAAYIALVQQHYPAVAVGFNGVYPMDLSAQQIGDIGALQADLHALGSRGLDFYRIDFGWYAPQLAKHPGSSLADAKVISDYCDKIGLPFSLEYAVTEYYAAAVHKTGKPASAADDTYYAQGLAMVASEVAALNWHPYQIDIQDWTGAPSQALPETDTLSFTGSALAAR
jgi:hypothetical protein